MNWLKLYAEFASDPKVQSMSEAMQRRFVMLLCLECTGDLAKLDDQELALAMRIKPADLEKTRDLFRRKGFIDETWSPKNWEKRQEPSDRTAAERMRRVRERQREQGRNVTRNVAPLLRVDTDTDTETEGELDVCVSHAREGDDLKDWQEAIAELQGSSRSKLIAGMLQESAEVPSVAGLKAWQFIHAAHVMQGQPGKTTWNFFMAVARQASRQEFDAWHDRPDPGGDDGKSTRKNGSRFDIPTPEQTQSLTDRLKELNHARG